MARDERGFLKADALRTAGLREQYAIEIDGMQHVAEIVHHHRDGYVFLHSRTASGFEPEELQRTTTGDDLAEAQRQYTIVVNRLRGITRGIIRSR